MAVLAPTRPVASPSQPPARRSWLPYAYLLLGGGLLVLVTIDGTPAWQVVRGAAVAALTGLALRIERRDLRWLGGVTALLAGLVGLIVGAGIGVMHAVKAGVTVRSVAGLVVLIAGLLLLGAGAGRLVRAAPGWWKLLTLPIAFVLLQFVLLPLPFSVYATTAAPDRTLGATPSVAYEDVTLRTSDGVDLAAWWLPSRNGAAVVLLHGASSTRSNVVPQAEVLARHGYGVLMVDTRGHGESDGRAMEYGWRGSLDVAPAVDWLDARRDVDRIGVVGMSMGGEQAVTAAAHDRRIAAVVGEGVEPRASGDLGYLGGGVEGFIEKGVAWVGFTAADLLSGAGQPLPLRDAVERIAPRPVLIIAAPDEVEAVEWVAAASPATVVVWAAGSPHTKALRDHPREWESRVTTFLDSALLRH